MPSLGGKRGFLVATALLSPQYVVLNFMVAVAVARCLVLGDWCSVLGGGCWALGAWKVERLEIGDLCGLRLEELQFPPIAILLPTARKVG